MNRTACFLFAALWALAAAGATLSVDEKAKSVSVSAAFAKQGTYDVLKGAIEYLVVAKGGKEYETIFVIEATPDVILPAYRSETEDGEEAYSINRDNALRILQTWCEDFGYEFRVDGQRRLYFGKNLGAVRQVVLRRTTNMDVKSLGDSADKLVNVLHC
ncbi:MAG TPA: hypothetical protein P5532_17980, partial [Planctomycetota bacterium]|nr:hypothetical protein [Planctomycetota bacterium]